MAGRSDDLEINERAAGIRPSATLAVGAKARALRLQGKHVFDFSMGEPDFAPPAAVGRAVAEAVTTRPVHYAPVAGLGELRELVAGQLGAYHGRAFGVDQVMVSAGAKHSLANLFMVTLREGDEVVIPAPYWVSYPDMVRLGGGVPRIVSTTIEDRWRLRPEVLEAALGPRTRFVLINSPSNPTGAGVDAGHLRALVEVVEARAPQAWLIFDDIYRRLAYDGFVHASAFRAVGDRCERIVLVDGLSKSHAMTGYRIGFLVAPAPVTAAASRLQGQMTSGVATPSQIAAVAALSDPAGESALAGMVDVFARRRALALAGLAGVANVGVVPPDGAFYLFVDVHRLVGAGTGFADDMALATWLLDKELVALVPGTPFGAPGHLRLSYATSDDDVRAGVARLAAALASLPARG